MSLFKHPYLRDILFNFKGFFRLIIYFQKTEIVYVFKKSTFHIRPIKTTERSTIIVPPWSSLSYTCCTYFCTCCFSLQILTKRESQKKYILARIHVSLNKNTTHSSKSQNASLKRNINWRSNQEVTITKGKSKIYTLHDSNPSLTQPWFKTASIFSCTALVQALDPMKTTT